MVGGGKPSCSYRQFAGRILIVDQDPVTLNFMQHVLKQSFYEVTICSFARNALFLLYERKDQFDIIFSDVNMPDMKAIEFLKYAGLEMNPPIIIMSDVGKLSLINGVHPRPYDILLKPIDLEKLCSILKRVPKNNIRKEIEINSFKSSEVFQGISGLFGQHNYGIQDMNVGFKQDNHIVKDLRAGVFNQMMNDIRYAEVVLNLPTNKDDASYARKIGSATVTKGKGLENNHDRSSAYNSISKKTRFIWTPELHQQFIFTINELENENKEISTKRILQKLNVPGMTTKIISSHLQKHRLQTKNSQNKRPEEHQIQVDLLKPTTFIAHGSPSTAVGGVQSFSEFSYAELKAATNKFNSECIVSEGGEKAQNLVYKGCLQNRQWIAVKKFSKTAWPDPKQFVEEARALGKFRHKRLANLIGYCCDEEERLLVAEFMPNDTLAKHLFHGENQTIEWVMRSKVALYIAEALDYCSSEGHSLYYDLNAYRVLFDEDGDPRLSCFGLMKNSRDGESYSRNAAPPEYLRNGRVTPESAIYSYGTVLLNLLSGKDIPLSYVFDVIQGKSINLLMDSNLEGNFCEEEALLVIGLAYYCLLNEPSDRPSTRGLISTLALLETKSNVG